MRSGGVCSGPSATMSAPIFRNGSMMRSIGRRVSDGFPTNRVSKVWPASKPASKRMVVPDPPQSSSSFGGVRTRFFPWTTNRSGSGCSIWIPSARNALTVCMQSSLGRKPRKLQTPLESAAMMAARCEILLSPGTVISASIRGARFTRSSISKSKKSDAALSIWHSAPAATAVTEPERSYS